MESISVCNHTMDEKNRKTAKPESDKYDYRQLPINKNYDNI